MSITFQELGIPCVVLKCNLWYYPFQFPLHYKNIMIDIKLIIIENKFKGNKPWQTEVGIIEMMS